MNLDELYEFARSFWIVWLMVLFVGIVWWVYRPKNRKGFEEAARIPLEDDDGKESGGK